MPAHSNAVSVLRLLTAERPELSVTDVSRLLGMPKSSASQLLKSMREEGLLPHVGAPPRYRVGHVFFQISWLYGCNSALVDLADRKVVETCRATRHGADVLVLRIFLSPEPLRVVTPVDIRLPAFAKSTDARCAHASTTTRTGRYFPSRSFRRQPMRCRTCATSCNGSTRSAASAGARRWMRASRASAPWHRALCDRTGQRRGRPGVPGLARRGARELAALASQRAEDAGADPATIELIEAEDRPIAYPPGNALRVRVKVVGDISRQRSVDDARDLRS